MAYSAEFERLAVFDIETVLLFKFEYAHVACENKSEQHSYLHIFD